MPSIERSFYLLNTRTTIFLYNWTQCIVGFSLLFQRYVRKGNDAKNSAILSYSLLPEPHRTVTGTQLDAAHAQLLEQLRPIAFASLEFQEIWRKIVQKPREWLSQKNLNFDIRNFLIIQNMQWKRFTANYGNHLCQNFIRSTCWQKGFNANSWCANDENNLTSGFLKYPKTIFKPCF